MNLESKLEDRNLKWNWDKIAEMVINDPYLLKELVQFSMVGKKIVRQNASAVLGKICDKKSALLEPYLIQLIDHLETNPIDAYKRNIMRTFQFIECPEEREGELFEIALNFIKSIEEPIAVKAFAMTSARRIAEKYPDLAQEVLHLTEIIVQEKVSSGMTNRGKKEITKLRQILNRNIQRKDESTL